MHTVIAGNGILALTTAFRLARRAGPNDRITLVGPRARPGSASMAAGAMLNLFAEVEAGSLDSASALFHFELSHLASQMWPGFEQELIEAAGCCLPRGCASCQGLSGGGCFDRGIYVVENAAGDGLDGENFDAILSALQDFNESHQLLAAADIPNYRPDPRYRASRALLIHGEGWFNPQLMLEKLDALLAGFPQVSVVDAMVQRLHASACGEIAALETADGRLIEGDQFLLAAGAAVGSILDRSMLDLKLLKLFYGTGVTLEISSPGFPHTRAIRTPNRGLAGGLYTVPYFHRPGVANDHVLIGASNQLSPEPVYQGNTTAVETLLRNAREQINVGFADAGLVRTNLGWRPVSQDLYPVIGRTSVSNLLLATGTRRDGFHMSPLLSDVLVAMLYREPVDPRWQMFAPERAPIRDLGREATIDKVVRQQLCIARQQAGITAGSRLPAQLAQLFRDDLSRLHDQVGALDWGIPAEMIDMYRQGHARA
jgi:glycine oxidase